MFGSKVLVVLAIVMALADAAPENYQEPEILLEICSDTADGKLDSFAGDCSDYVMNPQGCDLYNTAEFVASELCCACGGGTKGQKRERRHVLSKRDVQCNRGQGCISTFGDFISTNDQEEECRKNSRCKAFETKEGGGLLCDSTEAKDAEGSFFCILT